MEIKKTLFRTINYLKKFDQEIDRETIRKCLISNKIFSNTEIEKYTKKYKRNDNKYVGIKISEAKKIRKLLSKNREILFIGITGSVAIGKPKKNDDIDLMVITKANCLWRTRFVVRFLFFIKKIPHRKYNKNQNKNEFCFNLWLDENSLLIPKKRQNLRNAIDLVNIIPLLNRNTIYERLISTNKKWAEKFVINQLLKIKTANIEKKYYKNTVKKFTNLLWYIPQKLYLSTKRKNNIVTANQAFFHG